MSISETLKVVQFDFYSYIRSMILRKPQIEAFLKQKRGYLKKAPQKTFEALVNAEITDSTAPTTKLHLIQEVQRSLRTDSTLDVPPAERPIKRLFFDIETSPNIVFSWRVGRKLEIGPHAIIKERAIICASWKWEGEDKVYNGRWNNWDDKELCKKLAKIMDSADEIVTQNGDAFDIKWVRARCIFHDIPIKNKFNSIDTKKIAKSLFYFNSAKLDYMGEFLGVGRKIETDYDLWRDICLENSKTAMDKMVTYCDEDVRLTERVFKKLQKYAPVKKFKYV